MHEKGPTLVLVMKYTIVGSNKRHAAFFPILTNRYFPQKLPPLPFQLTLHILTYKLHALHNRLCTCCYFTTHQQLFVLLFYIIVYALILYHGLNIKSLYYTEKKVTDKTNMLIKALDPLFSFKNTKTVCWIIYLHL